MITLDLGQLAERSVKLEKQAEEHPHAAEALVLAERLAAAPVKIRAAIERGVSEDDLNTAQAKVAALEAEYLVLLRTFMVPQYVTRVLLMIADDISRWPMALRKGGVVTLTLPDLVDITTPLDGRPLEPPF